MADPLIGSDVLEELGSRGHEIKMLEPWTGGKVLAIRYYEDTGVIAGAASAKGDIGYSIGW